MTAVLLGVLAAFCWSVHDVFARSLAQRIGPFRMAALVMIAGGILLTGIVVYNGTVWQASTTAIVEGLLLGLAYGFGVGGLFKAFSMAPLLFLLIFVLARIMRRDEGITGSVKVSLADRVLGQRSESLRRRPGACVCTWTVACCCTRTWTRPATGWSAGRFCALTTEACRLPSGGVSRATPVTSTCPTPTISRGAPRPSPRVWRRQPTPVSAPVQSRPAIASRGGS